MTAAQRRAAMKSGDPAVLPRRDQGATRKLARDWVDSRRMASNYLLWLFPLMIVSWVFPALWILQLLVLASFLGFIAEWMVTGRRVRALATERYGRADGTSHVDRVLRRQPRLPAPRVAAALAAGVDRRPDLSSRSVGVEMGEHRQDAPVVVLGRRQPEPGEDGVGVLADRLLGDHHAGRDRGVGAGREAALVLLGEA